MRRTGNLQSVIGPTQISESVDKLTQAVKPENWKNIPMPVCDATKQIVNVMSDLRRFMIAIDGRFTNLSSTVSQASHDNTANFIAFKTEMQTKFDIAEQNTVRLLQEQNRALRLMIDESQK